MKGNEEPMGHDFDNVLHMLIAECCENIQESSAKRIKDPIMDQYWQDRKQTLLEIQQLRKECGE